MLSVSKLNLKTQDIYRINPPKGRYLVNFKLDPKSEFLLIEEARKLHSEKDIETFENGIEEAAIIAALKIPAKELKSKDIAEWKRLQVDPKYTGQMFAFQIKRDGEANKLAITKVEIIKTLPENNLIVSKLKSSLTRAIIHEYTDPIIVTFLLDNESIAHLNEIESRCQDENEAHEIRLSIQRAAAQWAYSATKMLKESGTEYIEKAKDPLEDKCYKFKFTIIDSTKLVVNKVRVIS